WVDSIIFPKDSSAAPNVFSGRRCCSGEKLLFVFTAIQAETCQWNTVNGSIDGLLCFFMIDVEHKSNFGHDHVLGFLIQVALCHGEVFFLLTTVEVAGNFCHAVEV